jgi:N-acyl homoserine lactone hydrolase
MHSIRCIPIFRTYYPSKHVITYLFDGEPATGTNYIFYIEGAERKIIVDTASPVDVIRKEAPPGFRQEGILSFEEALNRVGFGPDEVDLVILTHLHHDHYYNVFKCVNAEVVVQDEELKFAASPHPFYKGLYPKGPYEKLCKMKLRILNGDKEIVEGIRVLLTPGHSPGCQSVMVETAKGPAIISGFCCTKENFEPPEPIKSAMPVIPPGLHTDVLKAYDSMLRIKALAKIVIPLTDDNNPNRIP